jgi:hypothetical protein
MVPVISTMALFLPSSSEFSSFSLAARSGRKGISTTEVVLIVEVNILCLEETAQLLEELIQT